MTQDKIAFILWADRFDETLAALFVAELRKAGLRVKLVSLAGQPSSGAYGLTLVPDLTLEQALPLAPQASCVVIPCGASGLKRLRNDPRLTEFLAQAQRVGATLAVTQPGADDLNSGDWTVLPISNVFQSHGPEMAMIDAVRQVVDSLITWPTNGRSNDSTAAPQ